MLKIELTADEWQLYSGTGSAAAARKCNAAANWVSVKPSSTFVRVI